jgi:hypothetical protein
MFRTSLISLTTFFHDILTPRIAVLLLAVFLRKQAPVKAENVLHIQKT